MGDCFIFCDLLRKPELYLPKRHKNISCSRSLAIRIFECIEIMVNSNEIDFFFQIIHAPSEIWGIQQLRGQNFAIF